LPDSEQQPALVVIAGPTASGKSNLALHLAEQFNGEVVSCDSVAVYRGMDIGAAKPSAADRGMVPHHGLDLLDPDEPTTAGDYARTARAALEAIRDRGRLPVVAGGTGLYLRALLDGLAPAPPRDEALRERLRARAERSSLHRLLRRFDPGAAAVIHPNDVPKLIRSIEVTLLARKPQTAQWQAGREPLVGFRVLQLGLNPARSELYQRINERAAAMFSAGLLAETAAIRARFGDGVRALQSLGYAQALAVLLDHMTLPDAISAAQQGHRNYAKRQLTWFRRDPRIHWLQGFGDDPATRAEALRLTREHLKESSLGGECREG
jgi:tRNA dimethylallyltransferase